MSNNIRPKTLTQALLSLGRVHRIEDPIIAGLIALSKGKNFKLMGREEREIVKRHLLRLQQFCDQILTVIDIEGRKDFQSLPSRRLLSYTDTILGFFLLLPDRQERLRQVENIKFIKSIVSRILEEKAAPQEIDEAISKLQALHKILTARFETEVKISEKIISGKSPSI